MATADVPTGCYKCGQPGHWSSDCPNSSSAPQPPPPDPFNPRGTAPFPRPAAQPFAQATRGPHQRQHQFPGPTPQREHRETHPAPWPGQHRPSAGLGGRSQQQGQQQQQQRQQPAWGPLPSKPPGSGAWQGPGRGTPGPAPEADPAGAAAGDEADAAGAGAPGLGGASGVQGRAVKRGGAKRKLTPEMLLAPEGLPRLMRTLAPKLRVSGKRGHEVGDLRQVLGLLVAWQKGVFPQVSFREFLEKTEKLGASRHLRSSVRSLLAGEDDAVGGGTSTAEAARESGFRDEAASGPWGAEGQGGVPGASGAQSEQQERGGLGGDAGAAAAGAGRVPCGPREEEHAEEEEEDWWFAAGDPGGDDGGDSTEGIMPLPGLRRRAREEGPGRGEAEGEPGSTSTQHQSRPGVHAETRVAAEEEQGEEEEDDFMPAFGVKSRHGKQDVPQTAPSKAPEKAPEEAPSKSPKKSPEKAGDVAVNEEDEDEDDEEVLVFSRHRRAQASRSAAGPRPGSPSARAAELPQRAGACQDPERAPHSAPASGDHGVPRPAGSGMDETPASLEDVPGAVGSAPGMASALVEELGNNAGVSEKRRGLPMGPGAAPAAPRGEVGGAALPPGGTRGGTPGVGLDPAAWGGEGDVAAPSPETSQPDMNGGEEQGQKGSRAAAAGASVAEATAVAADVSGAGDTSEAVTDEADAGGEAAGLGSSAGIGSSSGSRGPVGGSSEHTQFANGGAQPGCPSATPGAVPPGESSHGSLTRVDSTGQQQHATIRDPQVEIANHCASDQGTCEVGKQHGEERDDGAELVPLRGLLRKPAGERAEASASGDRQEAGQATSLEGESAKGMDHPLGLNPPSRMVGSTQSKGGAASASVGGEESFQHTEGRALEPSGEAGMALQAQANEGPLCKGATTSGKGETTPDKGASTLGEGARTSGFVNAPIAGCAVDLMQYVSAEDLQAFMESLD